MRYAKCLGSLNVTAALVCYYYIFGNVIAAADDDSNRNSRNFERMYKWRNLQEGFQEAKICRKPIFLLIHKPGCPTCEKLKPKFTNSIRILDLSQHFVMVGVRKDEIPTQDEAKFQPDGTYVPRILFFTPDGEFMKDVYNHHPKADDKYKYFYNNTSQIIDSMILALKRCSEERYS
ncbi:Thioredoxin domain-containing protein 12 [Trachymyrmex zeteki]|uniref:Thioredoxin domain-containing protein 12 n=1 Tax=Mycetomoellerius zeteki TaxID=64791 RepID=A0A151XHF5_9HYME|nr:PREDICTED: thioredoxin domain-containing protein 12-like [Trachymyrmex zeteki]KYQ59836.1 Thioredoxin domain-containing protein 12 [Trachymyrmex zeteki]